MRNNIKKIRLINFGGVEAGTTFVVIFVLVASLVGFILIGGELPRMDNNKIGEPVAILTNPPEDPKQNLQLYTFLGATNTPSPLPPIGNGCAKSQFNTEDEILVGSDPAPGAATSGLIRVWVTDELAPRIAPNEIIDPITGQITTIGDRTARDHDSDGNGMFLWEPSIYVKPATGELPSGPFCDETKPECKAFFPILVKGDYNSDSDFFNLRNSSKGPEIDKDWENFKNGPGMANSPGGYRYGQILPYMAEFVWDTSKFGLKPGNYWAQFVIHDGDTNLGISCINIKI